MKKLLFIVLMVSAKALSQTPDSTEVNDPDNSFKPRILIINNFDAQSKNFRNNKKELFVALADSLKRLLYNKVEPAFKDQIIVVPGTLALANNADSVVSALIDDSNATKAIVIKNLDVYFDKTDVQVTGDKNSKDRKVFYDICSAVTYALYNTEGKIEELQIKLCEPYTERSSASGFFTIGPDIVAKRKDAFKMLSKNVDGLFQRPGGPVFSQESVSVMQRVKKSDTLVKYSLSFADQSQILYDGAKLKTNINQSFMESGDVSFYNGKYFNARIRYLHAFLELPGGDMEQESAFSKLMKFDSSALNIRYVKVVSRLSSTVGMLYETRGKYVEALALQTRALEIRRKWLGMGSSEYLNSLQNIAVLKKDMGLYEEADSIYNYLEPKIKILYSENSLQYVAFMNNRAMLLAELGRTKEARSLLDEALRIGNTILSASYFDYERILTNRALLEQESGDLDKAEEDYKQVLANMEKKGFEDHPDYNNVMLYYGSLRVQKNDAGILEFLSGVTEKVKKRYGENHPLMAKALINTGNYFLNKKSYGEAKDIFWKAATIQFKVLGGKHQDYLNTLIKLAVCEWQLHDNVYAMEHFTQAIHNYMIVVNTLFRSMSESEKAKFWRTLKPAIDTYFAYVIDAGRSNPSLLKDAYDLQLQTKGILINSTRQTRNIILNKGDSITRSLYNDWLSLKNKISTYYSSPLEDMKDDKINLTELEAQANSMEKELSRRSARFASEYSPISTSFDDIRASLTKDEAAVEIIRAFHYYDEKKGESEYIALVVKKDSLSPVLVPIGSGTELEHNCLSQYKKSIRNKTADTKSYTCYWSPLTAVLGKTKTAYVSVDGVYNSINLNTLQLPDKTFILDNYKTILISSTRAIPRVRESKLSIPANESGALLVGSPLYGNDEIISPLPGTREEVEQIDTVLLRSQVKSKVFIEQDASEKNIKSTNEPSILHLATHGFFNANVDLSQGMSMGVQVSQARDNALLRSGLMFNGAASIYSNEPVLDASNNGILYAYEVMNLDLQGTVLVVLSACETGAGEIINGEGVYGLARSFQIAGADKIIMSLWKVDDQVTRELMVKFYEEWRRLDNPQQAFIAAQIAIKKKHPQPYYWGAFVLVN